MSAQAVFAQHYNELRNPATPIVVEYGWFDEYSVAYELSRSEDGTLFGLTVVQYRNEDDTTHELREHRHVAKSLAAMRRHINQARSQWGHKGSELIH